MDKKKIKNAILGGIVALIAVIVIAGSCTVIAPNERGIQVTLGQVQGDVIPPGMKFHAPFITQIRKFRLEQKLTKFLFHAEVMALLQKTCRQSEVLLQCATFMTKNGLWTS